MNCKWKMLLTVCVVALAGLAWALQGDRENEQVKKIHDLQGQLFGEGGENLSEAQRETLRRQFREEVEKLSPDERRQVFAGFRDRMQQQIRRFHSLPPAERVAFLDAQIDRMQQRGGRRGGPGRGGNRPGGGASDEQRRQRMRDRLDNSTPRERAERAAFFQALRQRRDDRGLPPMWSR